MKWQIPFQLLQVEQQRIIGLTLALSLIVLTNLSDEVTMY